MSAHRHLGMLARRHLTTLIDTNGLVKSLEAARFTPVQAKAVCDLFAGALSSTMDQVEAQALIGAEFKRALHQQNSLMTKGKNEMQIRQSAELVQAKASLGQLQRELRSGRQKAREALGQLRSELRLDLSMEKGKQRDAWMSQLLRHQDVRARIDAEVANGHVALGKLRHDIFYSMTGFFFTSVAALFGYLRYIA